MIVVQPRRRWYAPLPALPPKALPPSYTVNYSRSMFYKLHGDLHERDWSACVPKVKQHLVQDFEDAKVQSQKSFLWFGDQVRQDPLAEGTSRLGYLETVVCFIPNGADRCIAPPPERSLPLFRTLYSPPISTNALDSVISLAMRLRARFTNSAIRA